MLSYLYIQLSNDMYINFTILCFYKSLFYTPLGSRLSGPEFNVEFANVKL